MSALSRGRIYGAVTVGERGQVVIPAGLRKSFKAMPGDKLLVFAKPGGMIGLMQTKEFDQMLDSVATITASLKRG